MNVFHTITDYRQWRRSLQPAAAMPFVPTMGTLHPGHASLIRHARDLARDPSHALVVASIFVNPTQFGPAEDFTRYPRTLEADLHTLAEAGCDAVFVPSAAEMYPGIDARSTEQLAGMTAIDPGPLANDLEGALRPGHFRGVCSVVAKLLNIVEPTHLLLGRKDYQQQAVLRRMCIDLNLPVEVITCPTVREPDGLAMSSRNRYLSPEDRARAPALYAALQRASAAFAEGERRPETLERSMRRQLEDAGLEVQYAVARHAETLAPWPANIDGPCVLLVAAKLGATRLIDNLVL